MTDPEKNGYTLFSWLKFVCLINPDGWKGINALIDPPTPEGKEVFLFRDKSFLKGISSNFNTIVFQ